MDEQQSQSLLGCHCDEDDDDIVVSNPTKDKELPNLNQITQELLGDVPPEFHFLIQAIILPDEFEKKQCRQKDKPSVQRIDKADIKLKLLFDSETVLDLVKSIEVRVKNILDDTEKATKIQHQEHKIESHNMLLECNLNSYEGSPGSRDVYALMRTASERKKKFHIIVTVNYENGEVLLPVSMTTKPFLINGTSNKNRDRSGSKSLPSPSKKRRSSSFESNTSADSGITNEDLTFPLLPPEQSCPHKQDRSVEVQKLIANHVRTKCLEVDGVFLGKQMSSPNGDIAYHFYLDDQDEIFEEGQVVGFVPSKNDPDRKQVIVKLNFETASQAILKGVVTRSQYFEAKCPHKSDTRRTETICMMGIVPVQVIGSVSASEFLYASPTHPGYAISGFHLDFEQKRDAAVIGVAFSSHKTDDEKSVGYVEAGVSVMQFASQFLVNEKLRNIEESFDDKIKVFRKSGKHWRRGVCIGSMAFSILLLLTVIFMWQLFTPGSAYRHYRCSQGQKSPHGTAWYTPMSQKNLSFSYDTINGTEFDFKVLLKKLDRNFMPLVINGNEIKEPRYFLNPDRCASGGSVQMKSPPDPDMFAVGRKCYRVYVYDEVHARWRWDERTDRPSFQNVGCDPPSRNANDE